MYTFGPSTRGGKDRWISEFENSLVYRESSKVARATQRNLVWKNKRQKKKKKKKKKQKKHNKKKKNKTKKTKTQKPKTTRKSAPNMSILANATVQPCLP